jgi:hypothetical protein
MTRTYAPRSISDRGALTTPPPRNGLKVLPGTSLTPITLATPLHEDAALQSVWCIGGIYVWKYKGGAAGEGRWIGGESGLNWL